MRLTYKIEANILMQKVRIKEYSKNSEGYQVYLGNGTRHQFTSLRNTKRFLAVTNTYLTQKLYELRSIYKFLWIKHQDTWAYFDQEPVFTRKIKGLLDDTEIAFNNVVQYSSLRDGNHMAFKNLFNAIDTMKNAILPLAKLNRRRSATFELYEYDNAFKQLTTIHNDLTNYGQMTADLLMPTHLSMIEESKKTALMWKM